MCQTWCDHSMISEQFLFVEHCVIVTWIILHACKSLVPLCVYDHHGLAMALMALWVIGLLIETKTGNFVQVEYCIKWDGGLDHHDHHQKSSWYSLTHLIIVSIKENTKHGSPCSRADCMSLIINFEERIVKFLTSSSVFYHYHCKLSAFFLPLQASSFSSWLSWHDIILLSSCLFAVTYRNNTT